MTKSDVQTSLRLPEELRDRLSEAAAANGHGIGEEIRQRLEGSFVTGGREPKTVEMAAAVARIASDASSYYRPWYEDPFTFEVVKAAVPIVLAIYQPKGDPVPRPNPDGIAELVFPGVVKPEEVARTLAAAVISNMRSGR
jgi:hypothetical protein